MKKIYAILAAALMSASLFATPAKVPTLTDLAANYDVTNNIVLCFYFDGEAVVCNDIVLTGTINGWSDDATKCPKMEALTGDFEGWYAYEFEPAEGDNRAKPVQLKSDGTFSWDFQPGDPEAWVNMNVEGSKEITLAVENSVEASVLYPSAGAYIYNITYWKNHKSPCVVIPSHKYTIYLFAPECEYVSPAIVGDFDGWKGTAMNKTTYDGDEAYMYVVEDEEGHGIKFYDPELKWDNQIQYYDAENDAWKDFDNYLLPVATKDTTLVFDYYDPEKYRWPQCVAPEEAQNTIVGILAPVGAPAEGIDVMGSFDDWGAGVKMEYDADENMYMAVLQLKSTHQIKFRQSGSWDNQIQMYDEATTSWKDLDNITVGEVWQDGTGQLAAYKLIALDFSNVEVFKWTANAAGIESVTLTEKAQKVVIDGVLYIIRDNKMYNAQGTQVR